MRITELGTDATAEEIRALAPAARDVETSVRNILAEVRVGGDGAVLALTRHYDHADLSPADLRVAPEEVEAAVGVLAPDVLSGLRTAIANVRAMATAQLRETTAVELSRVSGWRWPSSRFGAPPPTCPAGAPPIPPPS